MNWIKLAKLNAEKLGDYCHDLEAKNEHLRKELQMIAAGFHLSEHKSLSDDHGTLLQLRAAKAIGVEASMKNRIASRWIF